MTEIRNADRKIVFADTAFAFDWSLWQAGIFEYSFVEPYSGIGYHHWPTMHFRHGRDLANIAWADGHATSERYEWDAADDRSGQ